MNLLIEQQPRIITSKLLTHQQSNDVKKRFSPSSLVFKLKRQKTKLQTDLQTISFPMSNEENNSITNQRSKRSIPNSSTRRPSSPAFNGKQQQSSAAAATKRSVIIDNNNNDLTSNIDENSSTKRFKQDDLNVS